LNYHQNSQNYWMAGLDCGHVKSLTHKPPFRLKSWVRTAKGRQDHLGSALNCPACDRLEWPEGLTRLRRTPEFTADKFPAGLAKDHSTKAGVWGLLHILEGRLKYVVQEPEIQILHLETGDKGVIPPTMLHHIETEGPARFFVEFFALASTPQKQIDHVELEA